MTNIFLTLLSLAFTGTVKSEHHLRKQGFSKIEVIKNDKNVNKKNSAKLIILNIFFQKNSIDF